MTYNAPMLPSPAARAAGPVTAASWAQRQLLAAGLRPSGASLVGSGASGRLPPVPPPLPRPQAGGASTNPLFGGGSSVASSVQWPVATAGTPQWPRRAASSPPSAFPPSSAYTSGGAAVTSPLRFASSPRAASALRDGSNPVFGGQSALGSPGFAQSRGRGGGAASLSASRASLPPTVLLQFASAQAHSAAAQRSAARAAVVTDGLRSPANVARW